MSIAEPKHEIVRFEPNKPIQSGQNLKSLLISQKDSLAQALPRHVTPERIIKTMLVAANRVPDLLQCTQASILETINRAAELGLDLSGTLGEAYPVPFNNKVGDRWVKQCQLVIGYRGLAKLARQSGEIKRIEAEVVYEKDKFVYRKGSTFELDYYPCLESDRGAAVGAYALVQFKDGGIQAEFMPVSEIEKIRARSKAAWDRNGNPVGPWKDDWAEMARKTVFRRLAKWLPLSAEKWQEAIEHDNQQFDVEQFIASTPTPAPSLTAELMDPEPPVEQEAPADEAPRTSLLPEDGGDLIEGCKRRLAKCRTAKAVDDLYDDLMSLNPSPEDAALIDQLCSTYKMEKGWV